eukprot:scaffold1788_cov396-Prasinococcus_capsulatus_cf.AAC.13
MGRRPAGLRAGGLAYIRLGGQVWLCRGQEVLLLQHKLAAPERPVPLQQSRVRCVAGRGRRSDTLHVRPVSMCFQCPAHPP